MASKAASGIAPSAAGIFADMTVDGPEIGTLVAIVDRGKNLPNKKTMGKQNPYCAARLGKEARKTETDKRGGQTPRWDQELRFTVHDSPDYYSLKLSVFSEDNKRTDLVGEAWVNLEDVIVPGGGKSDLWQGLNMKGKYAGEVRVELTYYDTREKPEKAFSKMTLAEEMNQQYNHTSKVKRRPLPVNHNTPSTTPVNVPARAAPGRARHGPRDYSSPLRVNSMPPETLSYPLSASSLVGQSPVQAQSQSSLPSHPIEQPPVQPLYAEYDPTPEPEFYEEPYPTAPQQPDFLPQLPPSNRQRMPHHVQPSYAQRQMLPQQELQPQRPYSHIGLPHSNSAPVIPTTHQIPQDYHIGPQLRTDYPEPIPDVNYQYRQVRQRRHDVPPGWESEYDDSPYHDQHHHYDEDAAPPPPPPVHSNSAPAVPQYDSPHSQASSYRYGPTPPRVSPQQPYLQDTSPLQSIERNYSPQAAPSRATPPRGRSVDDYSGSPASYGYGSSPTNTPPHQTPPSIGRTPPSRQHPSRHSVADPYGTPSRPHPLSQEVPRARSPSPYNQHDYGDPSMNGQTQYRRDYRGRDAAPLIKPRAISPQPEAGPPPPAARAKSSYNIRHPVRAFESSDESPLSTSQSPVGRSPHEPPRYTPTRKSVSPRPSSSEGRSAVPFSPDSFDVHNPNAPGSAGAVSRDARSGPIVGWHGNEIDPSDHLPVDSWAPEPEKKTPTKTYGMGRDRGFGPRSAQSSPLPGASSQSTPSTTTRISKNFVMNVRMKGQKSESETPPLSTGRNRLTKKLSPARNSAVEPLREHENFNSVPNPYEQQQHYSRGFTHGNPGVSDGHGSRYDNYGPPSLPPKVPLQQEYSDPYSTDALSREISTIDIGTSRNRAPTAYQPVRSHRDRDSYY